MAQIAFGLVANVGLQLLANALTPETVIKGPKPEDDRVQISTYGKVIPIVHGQMRLAGNVIAMPEEMEVKKIKQSVGKGGGGTSTVTFRRIESYEIAIADAPGDVLAIWANTKLIYDVRDGAGTVKLKQKYRNMTITVRTGAEDQLPAAKWEAEYGAGNVPAGRGVCSVLIEDIPLDEFGNLTPNFTVLYVSASTEADFPPAIHGEDPTPTENFADNETFRFDRDRGVYWAAKSSDAERYAKFDAITGNLIFETTVDVDTPPGVVDHWDIDYRNGDLITMGDPFGTITGATVKGPVRINGRTGEIIGFTSDPHGAVNPGRSIAVAETAEVIYAIEQDALGGRNIYCWNLNTFELLWTKPTEHFLGQDPETLNTDGSSAYCYMSNLSSTVHFLTKISAGGVIQWNVDLDAAGFGGVESVGFWREGNVVVLINNTWIGKFDPDDGSLISKSTEAPGSREESGIRNRISQSGIVAVTETTGVTDLIDLSTDPPTFIYDDLDGLATWSGSHGFQSTYYWEEVHGIIVRTELDQGDNFDLLLFPGKEPDQVILSTVVSNYIQHTSMELADFDVSALTDVVQGVVVRERATVRNMIEPLRQLYFFDGTNQDGQLVFVKRGGAVTRTFLNTDEMAAHAPGDEIPPAIERLLAEEVEVPRKFVMRYFDLEKDYDVGSQEFSDPTAQGDAELDVEYHLAFDKDEARQRAEQIIQEMRLGREQATIRFGPKHWDMVPTDVIEVAD